MMKCPTCGRDMVKGAVISSSSMPFSTNVMFKPDRNDGSCGHVFADYKIR